MSVTSHLSQLRQKHEALSQKIESEQRLPGRDELEISALKKQKLMVKDEIARLSETRH